MSGADIDDFRLERYFARWEFAVRHQLSASDVEALTLAEVLAMADGDALERWERLSLGYTESGGLGALREEIARQYACLRAGNVLVTVGAEEGIFLTMHALLRAGDEVVVVTPAYQSLHAVARSIGARVTEIALRADDGWQIDVEEVGRAVSRRTRMVVVNFPHNPTGAHITADEQRRLVDIAESAGAVLFSDEVYRGLEYRTDDAIPPAAELAPSAVSLGVMSKSMALPGLRIGWLATRNQAVLDGVARLKDYTTICASAPSELLALIALRAGERVLARSRSIVAHNVGLARAFIEARSSTIRWTPPRAGSVAFPELVDRDAEEVSRELAEHCSVLLMPGSVFGRFPSHFRIGLGRRDLADALEPLAKILDV